MEDLSPRIGGKRAPEGTVRSTAPGVSTLPFRPRPHPWRWVVSAILLLLLAALVVQIANTPDIHFAAIPKYFVDPLILKGVGTTIMLMLLSLVLALFAGVLFALARLSQNPVARSFTAVYLWIFLSTPAIVQLIFWYNLAIVFPTIRLGIPGIATFWSGSTNDILTPLVAATVGLGLHEAAYFCEVIRSGLLAVDRGQTEAAKGLGMRSHTITARIILPQALRVMLPPGMTRVIALMKETALVVVFSGGDLMTVAQSIYTQNFMVIELLCVVCGWYIVLVSILMLGQRVIERWASRYQYRAAGRPVLLEA